jgi:DNA-binding NarL/FixJ family response regulator
VKISPAKLPPSGYQVTARWSRISGRAKILRLIASGWTADQIATSLNLSVKTVQNYYYQIKSKIGARTDAHLVWLATAAGIVRPESVG